MTTATATEVPVVQLNRTFSASRERVFAAWSDPTLLKQWFGRPGSKIHEFTADVRVGGEYRLTMDCGHGVNTLVGEYREVTPPSRLSYTWAWLEDDGQPSAETLVTIDFLERDGGTEVSLTHERLTSVESAQNHELGWNGCFENLAAFLEA